MAVIRVDGPIAAQAGVEHEVRIVRPYHTELEANLVDAQMPYPFFVGPAAEFYSRSIPVLAFLHNGADFHVMMAEHLLPSLPSS